MFLLIAEASSLALKYRYSVKSMLKDCKWILVYETGHKVIAITSLDGRGNLQAALRAFPPVGSPKNM